MTPAHAVISMTRPGPFYRGVQGLVRAALIVWCRVKYRGGEKVPRRGPLILVANHQSYLDPFLVGAGIPRRPHYLVFHTYWESPFLGPPIRALGGLPVGCGSDATSLAAAESILAAGEALEIFPEGERSAPGTVLPFRRGFARLARRTRSPVLPIAIVGVGRVWPQERALPRPARVEVVFGRPLAPPEAGEDRGEIRRTEKAFAERVRRVIVEMAAGRLRPAARTT